MLVRALLAAVALSILLSIAPSLKAQGATTSVPSLPGPNGCGTGWNTWLVPDSLPVLSCAFESACNAHDVCYGKCE